MILKTKLYKHQVAAAEKLQHIKVGALYCEQGTGKTRIALELIKLRLDAGKIDNVLWLCPCSVKVNLKRDILKHSDMNFKLTICGIETLSSSIRTNLKLIDMVQNTNTFLIVDESNLVKNHRAKRTENITRLSKLCKYKLILNGTPISRCEKDLYSQWNILDWRILGYGSFWSFAANHLEYDKNIPGKINKCLNTDYLVRKIAPYTYQVRKSECLDLPEKTYSTKHYSLTNKQEEHYQQIADKLMFELDELEPYTIYRLFSGLQNVIGGFRVDASTSHITKKPFFKNPLDNPRMQTLLNIVDGISEKAIIFCKYTQEINDIVKILNDKYGNNAATPFYGDITQKNRQKNLESFSNNVQFLVANKTCAGYGLNLQFCHYVIYYSNDWDYTTRAQSEDRVHRIGQEHNVHIIDICASDTLDERILKCLWRKENLVESFKREIDSQKDNKELFAEKYIYKKDYKGRIKIRGTEKVRVEAFQDLKEDHMETFEGNYDKSQFYSLMGEFFAERQYRKLMPYLINEDKTIWNVEIKDSIVIGFIGYKETDDKINIGYCYVEGNNKSLHKKLLASVIKNKNVYIELEKTFDKSIYEKLGFKIYKETANYYYMELIQNEDIQKPKCI